MDISQFRSEILQKTLIAKSIFLQILAIKKINPG